MRLYPRMGQKIVSDPEYGRWGADEEDEARQPDRNGGFDFPDELADRLVKFHHRGKRMWETEEQRNVRVQGEEHARRRDPETLYGAVEDIANITRQLAGLQLGQHAQQNPEMDALRAQVAELQNQLAAKDGQQSGDDAGDGDSGSEGEGNKKPAPRRSSKSAAKSGDKSED